MTRQGKNKERQQTQLLFWMVKYFLLQLKECMMEASCWLGRGSMSIGNSVTRLGDFLHCGQLLKPLATIILTKSRTLLGNFCKGVKIIHFSCGIIFGQLLQTFVNFFLVTLIGNPLTATRVGDLKT